MTPKRQILVVEDNQLNREMLVAILSDRYSTFVAENGQEALDILRQHSDSISLVLLDLIMPVMDGYTFLDRIKEFPELSVIPVIVMTQNDSVEDEVAALAHGATDFVPKPYQPDVVLHRVASIINLRETSAMVSYLKYDRLTGLYSKDYFYQKMRERISEDPDQEYCIVCSNIENFKMINDSFGIQEGDRLLKEVADIAKEMVGSTGFCGRFSADRYLIFQKREREQFDRAQFGNFLTGDLSPLLRNTVMRWGIYEITDRSIPVERMCDRALMAVDSIKGRYDQYFSVYDESLRSKKLREQAITNAMLAALQEEQFIIHYQPKYDLKTGRMGGAEALVRWNSPEWGVVSPGEFIPLFEKNGFIFQLDRYVWEHTCAQLCRWQEQGYPLVPVSVNVSRADLYHMDLADTLVDLIQKYGIDPKYLHLEITESAYTENPVQITSTVETLKQHGFLIEMDDFGSGYSSLNMFSQMKLDILKLDMKFIQNETAKPANQSILNDIVSMAHRLSLKVVAEGVEQRDQVDRLRAIGCDYVQGYFFAKPMPAPEFEKLLKTVSVLSPEASPQPGSSGAPRLMVVDADAGYRERVRELFKEDFQVLEACDTDTALALLRACPQEGLSAMILSGALPDNGAGRILDAMRQDPAHCSVPVLAAVPSPNEAEKNYLPLIQRADDFLCKCHPTFDLKRRVAHMIDIAELKKREISLTNEAAQDPLTGLLNRRGLRAAVEALRTSDFPVAVCMFDLDNLKSINDAFGHRAGDEILESFSQFILQQSRNGEICCRFGGDEFILILTQTADEDAIRSRVMGICRNFQDCFENKPYHASCSAGIALCKAEERPSNYAIELADQALYRAKREKTGCCLVRTR